MRIDWKWVAALIASVTALVIGAVSLDRAVQRNDWDLTLSGWPVLFILSVLGALFVVLTIRENRNNHPDAKDTNGLLLIFMSAASAIGLWEFGKRVDWSDALSTWVTFGVVALVVISIVGIALKTRRLEQANTQPAVPATNP